MKITEVRIFPTESKDGKLKAFATMTFDDWFVVRNVKVIQGTHGLFVAMPSRKAMDNCPKCRFKNVRGSRYCNQCGAQLSPPPATEDHGEERQGSHMDIAHPISQECRVYIQEEILKAYDKDQEVQTASRSSVEPKAGEDIDLTAPVEQKEEDRPQPVLSPEPVDESKDIVL
ncbi:MAG: septation protein SpoVG family protein [Candidatus Tantalella remota]|nr:septation protein SpoVG family protein [Candidatus Tantalella remota]